MLPWKNYIACIKRYYLCLQATTLTSWFCPIFYKLKTRNVFHCLSTQPSVQYSVLSCEVELPLTDLWLYLQFKGLKKIIIFRNYLVYLLKEFISFIKCRFLLYINCHRCRLRLIHLSVKCSFASMKQEILFFWSI